MATWLKQNTAVTVKVGPFLDDADGNTVEGGLTITQAEVRLSKNGGNIAQKNETTSLVHDELGWYDCLLDATDTNTLGILTLAIHEAGALQVWHEYMVVPANVWDSLFGADALQVHAVEIAAGLITAAAIATDAIDADALAADAAAEIADAVWDEDIDAAHQTANTAGKRLDDASTTVSTNLDAAISSLNDLSAAQVNAEVLDVINTDTFAEPGQGTPGATISLAQKIGYLYKFMRNRVTSTGTTISVYNDDATTVDQKSTHSDNGTTYDRGEFTTGP